MKAFASAYHKQFKPFLSSRNAAIQWRTLQPVEINLTVRLESAPSARQIMMNDIGHALDLRLDNLYTLAGAFRQLFFSQELAIGTLFEVEREDAHPPFDRLRANGQKERRKGNPVRAELVEA